jgi:hypothetical protein
MFSDWTGNMSMCLCCLQVAPRGAWGPFGGVGRFGERVIAGWVGRFGGTPVNEDGDDDGHDDGDNDMMALIYMVRELLVV